jgi:peptide/nickel transport system permease protein
MDFAEAYYRRSAASQLRRNTWRFIRRKPLGALGALVILGILLVAIFADVIDRKDPNEIDTFNILLSPRSSAWLGTDNLGRDLYSRAIHGTRVAVIVGFGAVALASVGGTVIGLVSGFYGGKVDLIIQRVVDAILAFPPLILALGVVAATEPSVRNLVFAIAFVSTPGFSRIVRASVLGVKTSVFVEAAHSLGQSTPKILAFHILPNVAAPIIIVATGAVGGAILAEAGLSFLGLGPPPPNATWGGMLVTEARFRITTAWWLAVVPGAAITLAVLGFNLLGDALRDVLDPRLRGSR